MALWQNIAKLNTIPGESVGLWRGHKMDATGSDMLPLDHGAQCKHFRFYWTEDAAITSSLDGSGNSSISHHIVPIAINSMTLSPFEQVQALANTLECCWEMLFTSPPQDGRKTGGYGFRPITSLLSRNSDGRIPVFIFDVPFVGKAAPEGWLQFNRSVLDDVDPTFTSKNHVLLIHSAPMHEMFHFVKMEYMGVSEGWVNWILEGIPRWSQEMWHGHRSGIMYVGKLFDAWTGKGTVLGDDSDVHLRSGYEFYEFWDFVGRRMSILAYGARLSTFLCNELDVRKDVCVGADVIHDFLEEWDRIPGPVTNAERAIQALSNVGNARGKPVSADELEWAFLSQDWLGEDIVTSRGVGQDRLQLYCKQYPLRVGQANYLNAFEMPSVYTSTYQNGTPLSWTPIGGPVTSAPAAIGYNNHGRDQVHVFARGSDGKLWTNIEIEDSWTGWHSLSPQLVDPHITSAPVAVVVNKSRPASLPNARDQNGIHVFARGKDGLPWTAHFNGTQWWGGRTLSGMLMRGHPAAAVAPIRIRRPRELWGWTLYLFVWAKDGTLSYAKYQASPNDRGLHRWTGWQMLGHLEYTSSPACALLSNGDQHELVVVIRDENNHLRAFIQDNSGHWTGTPHGDDLGGPMGSGPGLGIINGAGPNSLCVFARLDTSGRLIKCTRQMGGAWSTWTHID